MTAPCLHCGRVLTLRPRRLCWRCYASEAVRERYPVSGSKFNRRGAGLGNLSRLATPTAALPGTAEKLAVMAERALAGLALFHPLDAVPDGPE